MRLFRISTLLAVVAFLAAACAGNPSQVAPKTLTIEAVDIGFKPATLEVTAGEPVKLVMQNNGMLEHDFSIMVFPMDGMPVESGGSGHDMGDSGMPQPELHMAAMGASSATLEFTPSTPGTYDFWCTVAGHKEAGMVGTLIVKAP